KNVKKLFLKKAFSRITPVIKSNIECFRKYHSYWIEDYALFMALKDKFGKPWYEWEEKYKFRNRQALNEARDKLEQEILFYCFEQYEFFRQWKRIKEYANKCGVGIFGDMPIYVCRDSVDVWAHPELFQLNKNLDPEMVAGVPPDYFAQDGQLWGNPLYNFEYMRKDGYDWFIKRIEHNLKLYNKLRIDHFRGFYKYWAVDADKKDAREGRWLDGPKMEIWNTLKQRVKNPDIVAEDLGIIDEEVHRYVKETGFDCTRVMQFAFDNDPNNIHLPHNYPKDSVGYTATHDNDTTLGWLLSIDEQTRNHALNYVNCKNISGWAAGGGDCPSTTAFIRCLLSSSCELAIVPMQDLCGYGSDTRMNTPGKPVGNWEYRTNYTAMEIVNRNHMLMLNNLYARNCPIINPMC
ncbi:MAG: 4-alpha-glucanotransferase, partial [Clostridia bacterium]